MAEFITMRKMSDTMTEGVVVAWLKKVGDFVKENEVVAEVETDKATMEFESYEEGYLLHVIVSEGTTVPIDAPIAIVGKQGEDISALLSGGASSTATQSAVIETNTSAQTQSTAITTTAIALPTNMRAVTMRKMSDTMQEGVVVSWLKKVGDFVKENEPIAEVETDKATMEFESYEEGYLLYHIQAGSAVPIDALIAVVGEQNADPTLFVEHFGKTTSSAEQTPTQITSSQENTSQKTQVAQENSHTNTNGRLKISPLARALAKEKGIDIALLKGTGENGRIVKRDIDNFKGGVAPAKTETLNTSSASTNIQIGQESFEEVNLSQMRKTIARRLSESKFSAPHFYLTMDIDMDNAIAARQQLNENAEVKISFNDMIVKAAALALRKHPKINASWLGEKIRYNHHIHVGIAVAVDEGLLVPVVRFADYKSLSDIAKETKNLAEKAKNKKLQPADWEGNTFSISNLGMFGIEEFTAIINPPDACILAIGAIKQVPVVKNNQVQAGNMMRVTLSCDHRVVDGALGAAFLQTLKSLLEAPIKMLA
ncbi:MAG: pyruvate dehydrogenase complex dihydrolipoamide acetyltransferase [Cytophagales bacterium]|nr:MAG: pyruvate dehydrogenase complex dihydrolipoamide acetyltransferase [Cytophagales bacterium]